MREQMGNISQPAILTEVKFTLVLDACLPIVYVPVHIVMGMLMTVGMRMRVAITMGIKNT